MAQSDNKEQEISNERERLKEIFEVIKDKQTTKARGREEQMEIIKRVYRRWHNGLEPTSEEIAFDMEFLDRCMKRLNGGEFHRNVATE